MPGLDERLERVLDKKYRDVEERISGAVLLGFVSGVFFAYSGVLGFVTGMLFGVITANRILPDITNYCISATSIFQKVLDSTSDYIANKKMRIKREPDT